MNTYFTDLQDEKNYLQDTLAFLQKELERNDFDLADQKSELLAARKEMWDSTSHNAGDFTKLTEMNQYLPEVKRLTVSCLFMQEYVNKYRRMLESPYFGRFDFQEDGSSQCERIYLGLANVMDQKTRQIYVYDWRAPVASIFYQYEPGRATYQAPAGEIAGVLSLKRQYKIQNAELIYFFDCSVRITDQVLQEILSRNSSPQMRNIVETIQKEQDLIIRDLENDLLIVQGTAGSGKTSVAMHRVAFLLYEGLQSKLEANNVLIVSPNPLFGKYISSVLPELGEENVSQLTFDEIAERFLADRITPETRTTQLESVICALNENKRETRQQGIAFKGSRSFVKILDRMIRFYALSIPFEDVYLNGITLETREQLKNRFLNNKIGLPMAKQLNRIEKMLLDRIQPVQKTRLAKLEKIVAQNPDHLLEIKSFSRLLSIKQTSRILKQIRRFTQVDYLEVYRLLFSSPEIFNKLAYDLNLPENIEEILTATKKKLAENQLYYEDCAPLLYLKLRLEGHDSFTEIKQVVIDEAQDYYPMHYEVFKLLFKDAKYTILGDGNQVVEKNKDTTLFNDIAEILNKPRSQKLQLKKGYRSTYEINAFNQRLLNITEAVDSFNRHEQKPLLVHEETDESMVKSILNDLGDFLAKGYETAAVICKTRQEAKLVCGRLQGLINVKLLTPETEQLEKGVAVLPAYLAKGLEFDAVLVYNAGHTNYSTELDRNLLYIACTRALHRLNIYYTGEKCLFFK